MQAISASAVAKSFLLNFEIIWHDPNIKEIPKSLAKQLDRHTNIKYFTDWKEIEPYVKSCRRIYHLVTTDVNGEELLQSIFKLQQVHTIHLLTKDNDFSEKWESKRLRKVKVVHTEIDQFVDLVDIEIEKWTKDTSKAVAGLPAYAPIFDENNFSDLRYLHINIKGLKSLSNREAAKADFISLSRALSDDETITEFESNYNDYNGRSILQWYTKECFFYKVTNNCLRKATSDSIQSCRFVLKDLEQAIKDIYQEKSKIFNGQVYRGAYLSKSDWELIEKNKGKDLEMYGFLSTSKSFPAAINFVGKDLENNALLTIIIPSFPDKGEEGYAELADLTEFKQEEEVLFNIMSRFTIVNMTNIVIAEKTVRHLVLLYGGQAMKKYVFEKDSMLMIPRPPVLGKHPKCSACKSILLNPSHFYFNFNNISKLLCQECIKIPKNTKGLPAILSSEHSDIVKLQGYLLPSADVPTQEAGDVGNQKFYWKECHSCHESEVKILQMCITCYNNSAERYLACDKCVRQSNPCLGLNHTLIVESFPFTIWTDKMSATEYDQYNYHESEGTEEVDEIFKQSEIYRKTLQFERAEESYQQILFKSHKEIYKVLKIIGSLYKKRNKPLRSKRFHNCAKEIKSSFINNREVSTKPCDNTKTEIFQEIQLFCNELHYDLALDHCNDYLHKKQREYTQGLLNLGNIYIEKGQYTKAITYCLNSVNLRELILGAKNADTADSLISLGKASIKAAQYDKSIDCYSKALKSHQIIFGDNHPNIATSFGNLGEAYRAVANYNKALEYCEKQIELTIQIYGKEHPKTAEAYSGISEVHKEKGDYQIALEFISKAFDINRMMLGEKHPDTATSYCAVGIIHAMKGDYVKAQPLFEKSLEIRMISLGETHPLTANSYNVLGVHFVNMGDYNEAEQFYTKSLEIREKSLGNTHPDTAISYNNLGGVYYAKGDYDRAEEFYTKSLEIQEKSLGITHPETANSYGCLGGVYYAKGDYDRAEEFYTKSLEIQEKSLGITHPSTATSYGCLGGVYQAKGDYDRAEEFYTKCLEIEEKSLGITHPSTATSYGCLGGVYDAKGDYDRAEEFYTKGLEIREKSLGITHPDTATSYSCLGGVYDAKGDYDRAEEFYTKCLEIREKSLGITHPSTATSYGCLGGVYQAKGDYDRAEEFYTKCLEIEEKSLGITHPSSVKISKILEEILQLKQNVPQS